MVTKLTGSLSKADAIQGKGANCLEIRHAQIARLPQEAAHFVTSVVIASAKAELCEGLERGLC
eukprot:2664199-Prorocentrum_lima.AAC.1